MIALLSCRYATSVLSLPLMVFSYIMCCSREKTGISWAVLWSGILFLLVFNYIHFPLICQGKYIQFFAIQKFTADCLARNSFIIILIFQNKMRNARNWIYF